MVNKSKNKNNGAVFKIPKHAVAAAAPTASTVTPSPTTHLPRHHPAQPATSQMLLTRFNRLSHRYTSSALSPCFSPSLLAFLLPFSTREIPLNFTKDIPLENHLHKQDIHVDESHILSQLSDILPISNGPSKIYEKPFIKDSVTIRAAPDGFLSPEDKFRGVFLQKLRGKSAIELALTGVGIEITVDLLEKVVSRGNLSGDSLVTFFNWARLQSKFSEDVDSYNLIIKALGRRKYFKHMMEMLGDMRKRGINPSSDTLLVVMDSFIRARQISKGIKMWDNLEDFGLKCNTKTFNVLLKCLTRRSYVGTACSLINKMRGKIQFDTMSYNLVIGGWSRFGRVGEVENSLEAMAEDGINPDSSTYSYILEGLGRAGRIGSAIKIFRELEESGALLDVEVYNAMIANYISSGDIDEGLKYFEQLLNSKYEPNMVTYVRLISGCLKARRVADAIEMFDQMLDRGIIPAAGTITSFIELLCSYGPPHAALMIYEKARKVGCTISLNSYKLLLKRLSKFGKCQMLKNIWREMEECGYSSDMQVYEYAINGFCNIGQLENAVLILEESLSKGFCPSRLICSKLNNKLLGSKKVEVAYRLFLKIKVARGYENAKTRWRAKGWHF